MPLTPNDSTPSAAVNGLDTALPIPEHEDWDWEIAMDPYPSGRLRDIETRNVANALKLAKNLSDGQLSSPNVATIGQRHILRIALKDSAAAKHQGCTVLPIDVSTQTRCQDLPPFAFPEVPESREDILAYNQWLEGFSFSGQQKKKVAEEKLHSVMSNTPDLLAEREKRRKLEAENLRLRKELADLKAAHLLFPEFEKETIVPKQKAMRSLEEDFSTDTCMEGVVKLFQTPVSYMYTYRYICGFKHYGDRLTDERIQCAQLSMANAATPLECLRGIISKIEDFHRLMNFLENLDYVAQRKKYLCQN
uniref:Uncharacterized protein n=1 Tax=Magallana gigas TaxID=29159 RepID=K1QU58_MAGGI